MPRRSFAAVALLAVLTLGVVTACRAEPGVAAYVGDVEITHEQVDEVVAEIRALVEERSDAELEGLASELGEEELTELRQTRQDEIDQESVGAHDHVAVLLAMTEAGSQYAESHQLDVPAPMPDAVAEQMGIPADHPYVVLLAEHHVVMTALRRQAQPTDPSEADQREAFENLRHEGRPVADEFEEVQHFFNFQSMGPQVGFRDLLLEVATETEIVINPRYHAVYEVPIQIAQATSWLAVPLEESSSAVVDSQE